MSAIKTRIPLQLEQERVLTQPHSLAHGSFTALGCFPRSAPIIPSPEPRKCSKCSTVQFPSSGNPTHLVSYWGTRSLSESDDTDKSGHLQFYLGAGRRRAVSARLRSERSRHVSLLRNPHRCPINGKGDEKNRKKMEKNKALTLSMNSQQIHNRIIQGGWISFPSSGVDSVPSSR